MTPTFTHFMPSSMPLSLSTSAPVLKHMPPAKALFPPTHATHLFLALPPSRTR
jgi:hypothetical protein